MFSQTQEYALRAVIFLAGTTEEGPVDNQRISAGTLVPASYLSKVMQALVRGEIVASRRGVGGGFWLAHDVSELTVLEVMNAVDPWKRIDACPLGLKTHSKRLCSMHARLDSALSMVEEVLAKSTIEDLMSQPGRPLPMVETPRKKL